MLALDRIFATFPTLETERCHLRAFIPDDIPAMFQLMSNAQVTRYLGRHPIASVDEAAQRVENFINGFGTQTHLVWAIVCKETGAFLGNGTLWHLIPEHDRAELGYILAPEAWGKGIATEVCQAIVQFGFTTMGLHSIEAQIDPENMGSRRVLEKLGFVQEGYYRENFYDPTQQQFTDTAVFSLLISKWRDTQL
jgi:ribosomal-protein-alanine N-acetyltransferase